MFAASAQALTSIQDSEAATQAVAGPSRSASGAAETTTCSSTPSTRSTPSKIDTDVASATRAHPSQIEVMEQHAF